MSIDVKLLCKACRSPLVYFGKESAKLSSQEVLDRYDQMNPDDPILQLSGIMSTNYFRPNVSLDRLECEELLAHNPKNIDALLHLGKLHLSEKLFLQAYRCFEKIVSVQPAHVSARQLMIGVLLHQEKWDQAMQLLQVLQKIVPRNPMVYAHMGRVLMKQKQWLVALQHFYLAHSYAVSAAMKTQYQQVIQHITRVLEEEND